MTRLALILVVLLLVVITFSWQLRYILFALPWFAGGFGLGFLCGAIVFFRPGSGRPWDSDWKRR